MNIDWIKVPDVRDAEGFAIKALANGYATAVQQQTAWAFILNRLCRVDDASFVLDPHGGDRASAYVEGRRGVGIALRTISRLSDEQLRAKEKADG